MFSQDTCDMIRLLNKHHVHYMVVGGYAAIYHGYVRFTPLESAILPTAVLYCLGK